MTLLTLALVIFILRLYSCYFWVIIWFFILINYFDNFSLGCVGCGFDAYLRKWLYEILLNNFNFPDLGTKCDVRHLTRSVLKIRQKVGNGVPILSSICLPCYAGKSVKLLFRVMYSNEQQNYNRITLLPVCLYVCLSVYQDIQLILNIRVYGTLEHRKIILLRECNQKIRVFLLRFLCILYKILRAIKNYRVSNESILVIQFPSNL